MASFIVSLFWFLLFVGGGIYLAYRRVDLLTSTITAGAAITAYTFFGDGSLLWKLFLWLLFAIILLVTLVLFGTAKYWVFYAGGDGER